MFGGLKALSGPQHKELLLLGVSSYDKVVFRDTAIMVSPSVNNLMWHYFVVFRMPNLAMVEKRSG